MNALSDKHVLAVSERSAAVWEYTAEEPPRTKTKHSYVQRTASHAFPGHGHGQDPSAYGADGGAESAPSGREYTHQYSGGNATGAGVGVSGREGGGARDREGLLMGLGDQGEVKKVLNIKNMPDSLFTASTLMLPALEIRGSATVNGMNLSQEKGLGMPSKPQHVLYCIAGHKLYAGTLPSYDKHNRETIHMGNNAIVDVSKIMHAIPMFIISAINQLCTS